MKVALEAVGALLLVDDDEFDHARKILGVAGNRTGLSSRFVLESKTRGKDTVAAELSTMLGAGAILGEEDTGRRPLELTRLQYCAHVNDWLSMILVPFGARCNGFLHGTSLIEVTYVSPDRPLLEIRKPSAYARRAFLGRISGARPLSTARPRSRSNTTAPPV